MKGLTAGRFAGQFAGQFAGRFTGIFAERPTEWIAVSNPGAGNQRFYNYVYMYMQTCTIIQYSCIVHALCGYTRHLRTCHYAAIHVNRPSGISQAAAIAVNRTQGVNIDYYYLFSMKNNAFTEYVQKTIENNTMKCTWYMYIW